MLLMTIEKTVRAEPAAVWQAILDPRVLARCIPGCESVSGSPEAGYEATIVQKVGPFRLRVASRLVLTDIVPGRSLSIAAEGRGGSASLASGTARLALAPVEGGTRLAYGVEIAVTGRLARLGARIVEPFARRVVDEFFARFQTVLEPPSGPDARA